VRLGLCVGLKPKSPIHHRVMAALNFLRYLLIRDKQEDNQVCMGRENCEKMLMDPLLCPLPDWCVEHAGEGQGAVCDPPQESTGSHKGPLQTRSGDEGGGGPNRKK